jgi:hypothetical protein
MVAAGGAEVELDGIGRVREWGRLMAADLRCPRPRNDVLAQRLWEVIDAHALAAQRELAPNIHVVVDSRRR